MEYFYRGFRFTKDKGQLDPRGGTAVIGANLLGERSVAVGHCKVYEKFFVFRRVQPGESAGGLCADDH